MVKVFISQPMKDRTDEEIIEERERAIEKVKEALHTEDVEEFDTFFQEAPHDADPLWFLGKSIQFMGNSDVACFIGDWQNYRGCCVEHCAAEKYGVKIMEV